MATVLKDIQEKSEKIEHVKTLVKKKAQKLEIDKESLRESPVSQGISWKEKEFSHPERVVHIATMFSGIEFRCYSIQRQSRSTCRRSTMSGFLYGRKEIRI